MYPWKKMYTIFLILVEKVCIYANFSTFVCVEKVIAKNEQKSDPVLFYENL